MLPITPKGSALTKEQAKILDDRFFSSNPLAYFSSRIASHLQADHDAGVPAPEATSAFFAALSLANTDSILIFDEHTRRVQVAVDALALRHHVSEALARLIHALLVASPRPGDAPCLWLAISEGPTSLWKTVEEIRKRFADDSKGSLFSDMFLHPEIPQDAHLQGAFDSAVAWTNYALNLLTDNELAVNAANNKLKHGLAVDARGDLRIDFILADDAKIDADGNIPLTAFDKATPVFDRPTLTYLSRPRVKPPQGVEATTLRVDLPSVLAEAWMVANVYAAIFHVAALRHFGQNPPENLAPYPVLPVGSTPAKLLGDQVLGYRQAITDPPDATVTARPSGLFSYGRFIPIRTDYEHGFKGTIIDA